jgi:hypothetical protein
MTRKNKAKQAEQTEQEKPVKSALIQVILFNS